LIVCGLFGLGLVESCVIKQFIYAHTSNHSDRESNDLVFRSNDQHLRVLRAQWYFGKNAAERIDLGWIFADVVVIFVNKGR